LFTHRQKRKEKGKGAKKEEEKAAPKEKKREQRKERKKEIQKCLHPLCPCAVLYCCLLELGSR
jgi:hypothetical protein